MPTSEQLDQVTVEPRFIGAIHFMDCKTHTEIVKIGAVGTSAKTDKQIEYFK